MKHTKKSKKRRIKITAVVITACILLGIIFVACLNIFVIAKADDYIITEDKAVEIDADCIIVLGALVYDDGTLSDILEDRVKTAVYLFKDGCSDRILMSGDNSSKSYNECKAMKDYAVSMGVDGENIHTDHAGFSTYESMYRARDIFEAKKVIIVTQKFHLSRAVYLARSLGLEAYGVNSDLRNYSSENYNNVREMAARVKAVYSAVVQPELTFLGEAIPIGSPGSRTDDNYYEESKSK